jgi:OOP family OmpA-OmpF porin
MKEKRKHTMKNYSIKLLAITSLLSFFLIISNACAFELITREDIIQGIITKLDLIKTADNAIILFDASSSMDEPYMDTGITRYEAAKKVLKERNLYFPDLGQTFGLYLYTPWKDLYSAQKYDRAKFAQALDMLPEKATEPTMLTKGLKKLDTVLAPLEGKTAVFIFTDGAYTKVRGEKQTPLEMAADLAKKYNVCFYLISTADDSSSLALFEKSEGFDFCSRVISFKDFIGHPEYNSEALFTVKATKKIVTITDKKVVGIKTNNFLFDFDSIDLSQDEKNRLELLALYLNDNKNAYAAMASHCDSIGTEDYNLGLSYRRVRSIFMYLIEKHNVDKSQLVPFWFGEANPIADNSTAKGRMMNRRVEIVVGGIGN